MLDSVSVQHECWRRGGRGGPGGGAGAGAVNRVAQVGRVQENSNTFRYAANTLIPSVEQGETSVPYSTEDCAVELQSAHSPSVLNRIFVKHMLNAGFCER